jgi:hypothetical protein
MMYFNWLKSLANFNTFSVMFVFQTLINTIYCILEMDSKTPEAKLLRVNEIQKLVHQLPRANFEILDLLVTHLCR